MSDPDSLDALVAAARARAFSRDGTAEDLARLRDLEAQRARSAGSTVGQQAEQTAEPQRESTRESRGESAADPKIESTVEPITETRADRTIDPRGEDPGTPSRARVSLSRTVALLTAAGVFVAGIALGAGASALSTAAARDARLAGFPSFSDQEDGEVGAAMRVFDRVPAPGELYGLDPQIPLSRLDSADTRVLARLNLGTVYGIRGYLGNRPGVCLVVVPSAGEAIGDCTFLGDFLTDGIALDVDGASIRWESTDTRVWVAQSFAIEQ